MPRTSFWSVFGRVTPESYSYQHQSDGEVMYLPDSVWRCGDGDARHGKNNVLKGTVATEE